jgi:hypothetical protein
MNINSISQKIKSILPEAKTAVVLTAAALIISLMSNVAVSAKITTELSSAKTISQVQEVEKNNDTFIMNSLDLVGEPVKKLIDFTLKSAGEEGKGSSKSVLIEEKKAEINQESSAPYFGN